MRCRALAPVVLAFALPTSAAAQALSVPSDTLLAGVASRGQFLFAYDRAAWLATDALLAFQPESTLVPVANTMLARQRSDHTWMVLFGRLTDTRDTFYLVFEALPGAERDSFVIEPHVPPTPLVGIERRAAAALHLALADFGAQEYPYNSYVLPRPDSAFFVYFLPAQVDPNGFLHGADVRYLVNATGDSITEKHRMHRALLNLALPDSAVGGMHTVLVDDVPQDSDVFLVLARSPKRPEFVGTANYNYQIGLDGSITWAVADRNPVR